MGIWVGCGRATFSKKKVLKNCRFATCKYQKRNKTTTTTYRMHSPDSLGVQGLTQCLKTEESRRDEKQHSTGCINFMFEVDSKRYLNQNSHLNFPNTFFSYIRQRTLRLQMKWLKHRVSLLSLFRLFLCFYDKIYTHSSKERKA